MSSITLPSALPEAFTASQQSATQTEFRLNAHSRVRVRERLDAEGDVTSLSVTARSRSKIRILHEQHLSLQNSNQLLETADNGMQQINAMLQRMLALSAQAQNGALSDSDRGLLDIEFGGLMQEIDHVALGASLGDTKLLNGGDGEQGVYLLDDESLQNSSDNGLLTDFWDALAGNLEVDGVALEGEDGNDILPGLPANLSFDLLSDILRNANIGDVDELMTRQSLKIKIKIKNVQMSGDGFVMQKTKIKINITSKVVQEKDTLKRLFDGDKQLMQELAFDGIREQFSRFRMVVSSRSVMQLHAGGEGRPGAYFTNADATKDALFGRGNHYSIADSSSAAQTFSAVEGAIHYLAKERSRAGGAMEMLKFEAQFIQSSLTGYEEIQGLSEDTDIAAIAAQYTQLEIQLKSSIAVLVQTSALQEQVLDTLMG